MTSQKLGLDLSGHALKTDVAWASLDNLMFGCGLLLALWATSYHCWRQLLLLIGEDRRNVALACTLLYLATIPALICRLTESMSMALMIAVAVLLLARFCWRNRIRRSLPRPLPKSIFPPVAFGIALLMTLLVFWALVQGHFWDENAAHFGVSSVLARGVSPPEHPLFPGQVFRYHYGFNVLVAQVMAVAGLGVASAIDIVAGISFLSLLVSAIGVGHQLGGNRGAGLLLLLLPLGSGTLQHFLFSDFGMLQWHWGFVPEAWYQDIPPPLISNFFQHPQGLAMGTVLAVIQLFDGESQSQKRAAMGAFMLGLLSLVHIVFFGMLGLGLGVAGLVHTLKPLRFVSLMKRMTLLFSALIIAIFLGGFFDFTDAPQQFLTSERDFFNESFVQRLAHQLVLFGLPLLSLPFAFYSICKRPDTLRVTALSVAIIGFLIPNFVSYERSWDIVKFLGVAAFFANLLLADVLARQRRSRFLVAAIVVLSCSTSALWLARTSFLDGRANIPKLHFPAPPQIAEAVAKILNPVLAPRDRVYSTNIDLSKAGLLTPGFSWQQFGRGYIMNRNKVDEMRNHASKIRRNLSPPDLAALNIRFLVLSPDDIAGLNPKAQAALDDRQQFRKFADVKVSHQERAIYERVLASQ